MFSNVYQQRRSNNIPIAHGEGNYYCDEETLAKLKKNNQIVFTYEGTIRMEASLILLESSMKKEMYLE